MLVRPFGFNPILVRPLGSDYILVRPVGFNPIQVRPCGSDPMLGRPSGGKFVWILGLSGIHFGSTWLQDGSLGRCILSIRKYTPPPEAL